MNLAAKAYETDFHRGGSRNDLIIAHLPLVKFLVGRMALQLPAHLDQEDLASAAVIGLITAAERFDPSRGVLFKTFAEQRIKGTILDELRAQDWLSRNLRGKCRRLEREFSSLEQKLGRNPESEEIAEALQMELEDYFKLLEEVHLLSFLSLNEVFQDDDGAPFDLMEMVEDTSIENPQNQMMNRQLLESLGSAIETLPEKERLVVTLYYYEELKLKEIGEIMGLTESRISQLHGQAVVRLKSKLKHHE